MWWPFKRKSREQQPNAAYASVQDAAEIEMMLAEAERRKREAEKTNPLVVENTALKGHIRQLEATNASLVEWMAKLVDETGTVHPDVEPPASAQTDDVRELIRAAAGRRLMEAGRRFVQEINRLETLASGRTK